MPFARILVLALQYWSVFWSFYFFFNFFETGEAVPWPLVMYSPVLLPGKKHIALLSFEVCIFVLHGTRIKSSFHSFPYIVLGSYNLQGQQHFGQTCRVSTNERAVRSMNWTFKQVQPGFTNYQPQPKYSWALSKNNRRESERKPKHK